jgi:uncharacterized protein (TIGR02444 family)
VTASRALWDWAVAVHQAPGVDDALIALQDGHGQCASFLLWAAWSARTGWPLDAGELARGAALALAWEQAVTAPIRAARRALKRDWPDVDGALREALRGRVKAAEFEAEERLMDALQAITPMGSASPGDVAGALIAASEAWSGQAPVAALQSLARMFETSDCW